MYRHFKPLSDVLHPSGGRFHVVFTRKYVARWNKDDQNAFLRQIIVDFCTFLNKAKHVVFYLMMIKTLESRQNPSSVIRNRSYLTLFLRVRRKVRSPVSFLDSIVPFTFLEGIVKVPEDSVSADFNVVVLPSFR